MAHRWRHANPNSPASQARRRTYASPEHRRLRAPIQTKLDAGLPTHCWRCGTRLTGHDWHLGHDDHNRNIYRGAECVRCNLKAAAKAGRQAQRAQQTRSVRRRSL